MNSYSPHRFFTAFLLILLFLPSFIIQANVTDLVISPASPKQGDKMSFLIKAQPGESVDVSIIFTKTVSVSNGEFNWRLEDVYVPFTPNSVSVKATDVETLHVSAKIIIWITRSASASGGEVELSQNNIPEGTYDIWLHGDAVSGASQISLRVKATTTITIGPDGEYTYSYDTDNIPLGTFTASVGGITKTVTLKAQGSQPPPVVISDSTSPIISDPSPVDTINITTPLIGANFSDDSRINLDSIKIVHNGEDVTDFATVTEGSLRYISGELENGTSNHIEIWVSDIFGNEAFFQWNFTIMVPPRDADIIITHLASLSAHAYIGQDVVVTVGVANVGDLKGSHNLTLYLNDVLYNEHLISLIGGISATYNFTLAGLEEGMYHISVGNLSENFRITSWTEENNRSVIMNELTSLSPGTAAELVETLPPILSLDMLNEMRAETSLSIFEALDPYSAIDILETAVNISRIEDASSLLLGIRENSSVTLLLGVEPSSGSHILDAMSKIDFPACAKRVESAMKHDIYKSTELLELIDANLLSEILYMIVWLPSTPSTVSDLFMVMNSDRVFEIIYLWFNQGYLDTIELVFNGLSSSRLEMIVEPLTKAERLELLPYLSPDTLVKIDSGLLNFPDLTAQSLETSLLAPMEYSVKARVENIGNAASGPFIVDLCVNGVTIDTFRADTLQFDHILNVEFIWEPEIHGDYHLKVMVDSVDDVIEFDESNNLKQKTLNIDKPEPPQKDYTYIILLVGVLGMALLLHKRLNF